MPESNRGRETNRHISLDGQMCRVIERLLEHYREHIGKDSVQAILLEDAMCRVATARFLFRQYHIRCWGGNLNRFEPVQDIAKLIIEARKNVLGKVE